MSKTISEGNGRWRAYWGMAFVSLTGWRCTGVGEALLGGAEKAVTLPFLMGFRPRAVIIRFAARPFPPSNPFAPADL
jgi:hypothetical protein